MAKVGFDPYGDTYTAKDRDLDEKRTALQPGYCTICNRRDPCRYHAHKD